MVAYLLTSPMGPSSATAFTPCTGGRISGDMMPTNSDQSDGLPREWVGNGYRSTAVRASVSAVCRSLFEYCLIVTREL